LQLLRELAAASAGSGRLRENLSLHLLRAVIAASADGWIVAVSGAVAARGDSRRSAGQTGMRVVKRMERRLREKIRLTTMWREPIRLRENLLLAIITSSGDRHRQDQDDYANNLSLQLSRAVVAAPADGRSPPYRVPFPRAEARRRPPAGQHISGFDVPDATP
jgi:hypothetical protein